MKTFLIDLDSLSSENFREIIGFTLTVGLNFRKIDVVKGDKVNQTLVIETATKGEEKAFNDLLNKHDIEKPIKILSNNKATIGLKTIGTFKQLAKDAKAELFYLDKSTGKRFVITK